MVALIISICALVVAVMAPPTVFQMLYGKPKIKVNFGGEGQLIQCEIQNTPITNVILRKMGVTRAPIQDLSVTYWITQIGSQIAIDTRIGVLSYYGNVSEHIMLPVSEFGWAKFDIEPKISESFFDKEKTKALEDGTYTIHISILYDHSQFYKTKNVIVRTIGKFTHIIWEDKQYVM